MKGCAVELKISDCTMDQELYRQTCAQAAGGRCCICVGRTLRVHSWDVAPLRWVNVACKSTWTSFGFCARQHYAIARIMLSPVRLSVRLSVTRVDQSKTLEVRIMQLSPPGTPW